MIAELNLAALIFLPTVRNTEYNSHVNALIGYTCAFPTMTSQHFCCERHIIELCWPNTKS